MNTLFDMRHFIFIWAWHFNEMLTNKTQPLLVLYMISSASPPTDSIA